MCLAIYRPSGAQGLITTADLTTAYNSGNNDGFGFMFVENGEVKIWKDAAKEAFPEFCALVSEYQSKDVPLGVHLRLATHGAKDVEQAHPYMVHYGELAIIHNGILRGYTRGDKGDSDTAQFAKQVATLGPVSSWWSNEFVWHLLSEYVGPYSNKVVFLRNTGECMIIGMSQGHKREDVWFSNRSYEPVKALPPNVNHHGPYYAYGRFNSGEWPEWNADKAASKDEKKANKADKKAEKAARKAARRSTWEPPVGSVWRFRWNGSGSYGDVYTCHSCVKECEGIMNVAPEWVDRAAKQHVKQCDYCNDPINAFGYKTKQ